jgi:hypothetical protein
MRNKPAEAETHWARAAELAPQETAYQVQLAMVQLGAADAAKRQRAVTALEQLRADPKQRAAATRALIIDGGTRGADPQRLRALASDLQSYPDAVFSDRLLYVEILRQLRDPAYPGYLAALEKDAVANATDAAGLLTWMAGSGNVADAVAVWERAADRDRHQVAGAAGNGRDVCESRGLGWCASRRR